ncbi:hypothetical protein [Ideonella sp. YS5]|uniref:hypothetical protein n=1 Tax=Ideonella sp. YS5 TaxID=3453714 RepID=UPI003EF06B82
MNPTDTADDPSGRREAQSFFAEWLLPLKHARLRRGQHYFQIVPANTAPTYWQTPESRSGGLQRCSLAEADASALLAALAPHWLAQGDADLAMLSDALESLRQQLTREADSVPSSDKPRSPSYSAYPLF